MTYARLRRFWNDRGNATVEFAFTATVLFLLILGCIAYALVESGDNAGTNAARDGARVGILYYANADSAGTNNTSIQNAVKARLAGLVVGTPTIAVSCYHANGTLLPSSGKCDPSVVAPGSDQIQVSVTWTRMSTSPFSGSSSHTDVARMTIVGTPPTGSSTTTPPGSCTMTLTGPPSPPSVHETNGVLDTGVTVSVTISSEEACGVPQVVDITPAIFGIATPGPMIRQGTSNVFSYTFEADSDVDNWQPGAQNMTIAPNGMGSGTCPGTVTGRLCANFTVTGTPTSSFAGIVLSSITSNPAPNVDCGTPPLQYGNVLCSSTKEKNNVSPLTAKLKLVDGSGNAFTNNSGSAITIDLVKGGTGSVTPSTLTVPNGASETTDSFTMDRPTQSNTLSMTATIRGTTPAQTLSVTMST